MTSILSVKFTDFSPEEYSKHKLYSKKHLRILILKGGFLCEETVSVQSGGLKCVSLLQH